jgi:hypothetical protein
MEATLLVSIISLVISGLAFVTVVIKSFAERHKFKVDNAMHMEQEWSEKGRPM